MELLKICKRCNEIKQHSEFSPLKSMKDGRHSYCKQCRRVDNIERYHTKKDIQKLRSLGGFGR